MGVPVDTLYTAKGSRRAPSGILAIRLAAAAGVTVEAVLSGKLADAGSCPTCGARAGCARRPPRAPLLADLRVAFDDSDAVGLDMLRPPRKRRLGPLDIAGSTGRHAALAALLAVAANDTEHGDPAGSGGSGAE